MPDSPAAPRAPTPWTFLIVLVIVSILVSALIAYLGITGRLGGPIPGTRYGPGGLVLAVTGTFAGLAGF